MARHRKSNGDFKLLLIAAVAVAVLVVGYVALFR